MRCCHKLRPDTKNDKRDDADFKKFDNEVMMEIITYI